MGDEVVNVEDQIKKYTADILAGRFGNGVWMPEDVGQLFKVLGRFPTREEMVAIVKNNLAIEKTLVRCPFCDERGADVHYTCAVCEVVTCGDCANGFDKHRTCPRCSRLGL